jgi:1,4-dihydroxy-2-naphthoate octaprenyltransferase
MAPWLLAARPKTLTASLSPVLLGAGIAAAFSTRPVSLRLAGLALASALCIQVGTNLVNDAADFEKGADTAERIGPRRVTQSGLLRGSHVMLGAGAFFLAAALLGIPLIAAGGVPVLVIGVLSLAAGYAYTAGPFPLAYLGLGEVFVLLFFGLAAVKGMAYVLTGTGLSPWAEIGALQVGLQSSALLAVNNCRDIAGDRQAGKRTLAARFGERFARVEIALLVALPYLAGVGWLAAGRPWAAGLPLLTLPLAATSLLQLVFCALAAAGLAI